MTEINEHTTYNPIKAGHLRKINPLEGIVLFAAQMTPLFVSKLKLKNMKVKDIKIGETYNGVKVLEKFREHRHTKYWCVCPVCGEKFSIKSETVGLARQCKKCNAKSRIIDITGKRFGRLVVIEYVGRKVKNGNRITLWKCKCDCGNEIIVKYQALVTGNTRSCGCLGDEVRKANIQKFREQRIKSACSDFGAVENHPLRMIWKSMITRCYNPNSVSYKHYGERNINVCDRWRGSLGFEHFVNDMGKRPSLEYTIDRIDVNGDYCPENCRWATNTQQANNKTDNVYINVGENKITAKQFCDIFGLTYNTVIHQLKKGLDVNIIAKYKGVDMRVTRFRRKMSYYNHNRVLSEDLFAEANGWKYDATNNLEV